ncbi:MAG: sulfatase-like hydrolase/transferase [Rhodobacterales bacterium]|nr:sulfatase-like hydrolase/transferase [Rhodobacterales bacterium]
MNNTQKALIGGGAALLAIGGVAATMMGDLGAVVEPKEPPNVLIILWDTTRSDRLDIYGYDLGTTPRMAKWAENAVVFENAISPGMWTVPSHASMFTGKPPTTHGANIDWRWLDNHHTTLGEHFGDNGYDTYAFSANPNLSPSRVNLLQGFDTIETSWKGKWKRPVARNGQKKLIKKDKSTEISPAFDRSAGGPRTFSYNAAPVTHQAFTEWLDTRESEQPFLAYLSYMEAHKPRVPTIAARRRVSTDDDEIRLQLATDLSFNSQLSYGYDKVRYTDEELVAINHVYDACLVDLDEATGNMLDDLEQRGVLENTIVVFTSDHGELLGEHQLFGHRNSVYHSLVHIPLVVSWPASLKGRRVTEPVSNMDTYNTLVELAGLPSPPDVDTSRGNYIEGKPGNYGAFSESTSVDPLGFSRVAKLFPGLDIDPWNRKFRALVDGNYKLITDTLGGVELYDLVKDHNEVHNLAEAEPNRTAEMQAKMDELTGTFPAYNEGLREDGEGEVEDDAATKAQLELLGYIDDEEEDEEAGDPMMAP